MSCDVGDFVTFWRRDKGGKSQIVQAEVLEVIGDWVYVRRCDTGEERHVDGKRLTVVKLAPIPETEKS